MTFLLLPSPVVWRLRRDITKVDVSRSAIDRLFDRLLPRLRAALLSAIDLGTVDIAAIEAALAQGDVRRIEELLTLPASTAQKIADALFEVAAAGAKAGVANGQGEAISLDPVNPYVRQYVMAHAADLVARINTDQRTAIRAVIDRGFREAVPIPALATDIARIVDLLPIHALAVQNFRLGLLSQEITEERANTLADSYAERLLRYRANNIARTETLSALNTGEQMAWEQLAREGVLDEEKARRGWLLAPSKVTCPRCRSMNGQVRGLREPFVEPATGISIMSPPLHPSCRCTVNLLLSAGESTRFPDLPDYEPDNRDLRPKV